MQPRIAIHTIFSIVISIITILVFLVFSLFFGHIVVFYLGVPFALCVFFLSLALLGRNIARCRFKITDFCHVKPVLYLLAISSIIIVLLVPPYNGSMLEWMSIPLVNWARYLSSLLLTSFLPGYFLLEIIDKKGDVKGSVVIVLSYLLSIFITFVAAFLTLLSANPLSSLDLPIMTAVNIALIIAHFLIDGQRIRDSPLTVNWIEFGLFLSMLCVVIVGSVVVMVNNLPLTPGDMHVHYGVALNLSRGFPAYGGTMSTYPGGYLFQLYLSLLFALSGIPPALAEQGLYILSFMPLLAFYSTLKAWFSKTSEQKLVYTGALLSLLLGFGGLYALYVGLTQPAYSLSQLLGVTTEKTYDIYMRILYLPDLVTPFWSIGLPVFFTLLFFLRKKSSNLIKVTLIPVLVSLGYLGYTPEVFLFTFILFIYVVFIRRSNEGRIGPYVVSGLIIVALLDLIAPAHVYVLSGTGLPISVPFFATLVLAVLTSAAELAKDTHSLMLLMSFKKFLLEKFENNWRYYRWILLYIYVFFFVVWLTLQNDFNLWQWGGDVPFFVFPLRFGAVGLLAVVSMFLYFKKIIHNRPLLFFALLIPIGFLLEQIGNYYQIYPAYRYGTITFVGACVIAAYGVTKAVDRVRRVKPRSIKRNTIVCVLLGVLMISGMLSTTLYYVDAYYYSASSRISQDMLTALDYIRQNTPANASVLTFTPESANDLRDFAGINAVQDAQRWSELLLSTSNPDVVIHILSSSNIKYIYVAQADDELLNSSQLRYFVDYFPQVVKNAYATVYEVPLLTGPSAEASFGVLHFPSSVSELENATWTADSFTEGWYPYRQYGGVKNSEFNVSNGIMGISVTSNQSGNVWASYARSGLSLNTTIFSTLFFKYYVENNLTWFTFELWNSTDQPFFFAGHLSDTDFTTKDFILPENQIVTRIEVIAETVSDAPANTTARAYVDYIQLSAPTSTWKDDTFLEGWEFYQKYGNVSDWSAHSDGNTLRMSVTSAHGGNVWISYSLPLTLQTKNSVLSFRYAVDNDYTWFTIELENSSQRIFYEGHLNDRDFTTKSYLLPDDQTITRVVLIIETSDEAPPQTSAVAQIDSIEISQLPYSQDDVLPSLFVSILHSNYSTLYVDDVLLKNIDAYLGSYTNILLPSDPPVSNENLNKWVSVGNTLTVFNTDGNGFFADLLRINDSSPLVSITNFDLGRVIYVDLSSSGTAGNESEIFQPEFLENFEGLLHLEETHTRIDVLPVYNSISGDMQVKGDLQVNTDALMLQSAVGFEGLPFPLNSSTEIELYGKVDLTINNSTLLISPSESYMQFKPENYSVEAEVFLGGTGKALIVSDAVDNYELDLPASFKFNTTSLSVYARLPSVNVTGTIIFDQLDVHVALYVPLAGIVQQSAEIQGNVRFDTMYISKPVTIFSMFQAEGNILNLAQTTSSPATIPWAEVVSSPYNIAFNAAFLLCMAIYIAKKRNIKINIKIRIQN